MNKNCIISNILELCYHQREVWGYIKTTTTKNVTKSSIPYLISARKMLRLENPSMDRKSH